MQDRLQLWHFVYICFGSSCAPANGMQGCKEAHGKDRGVAIQCNAFLAVIHAVAVALHLPMASMTFRGARQIAVKTERVRNTALHFSQSHMLWQ